MVHHNSFGAAFTAALGLGLWWKVCPSEDMRSCWCQVLKPHFLLFLQDGCPGVLPGSTGSGFISSGCSSLSGSAATARSVHVRGLHKWKWQGKQDLEQRCSRFTCLCVVGLTLPVLPWQLHSWLVPAVENISTADPLQLSALSSLLPQLGAPFLLSLPSQLLLELLSQPGIHKYSPAQVSSVCVSSVAKDFVGEDED